MAIAERRLTLRGADARRRERVDPCAARFASGPSSRARSQGEGWRPRSGAELDRHRGSTVRDARCAALGVDPAVPYSDGPLTRRRCARHRGLVGGVRGAPRHRRWGRRPRPRERRWLRSVARVAWRRPRRPDRCAAGRASSPRPRAIRMRVRGARPRRGARARRRRRAVLRARLARCRVAARARRPARRRARVRAGASAARRR